MVLALSACNGKQKPSSSSGNQSSEEPLTIPTPAELVETFQDGSFKLTIFEGEYDVPDEGEAQEPEDFEYAYSLQIHKEGAMENAKVAYLMGYYGEDGYEYKNPVYGETINSDIYSYEFEDPYWLRDPQYSKEIESTFDVLTGIIAMFQDIEEGSEYTWTHNEENNSYHGEYDGGFNTISIDLDLCLGFFDKIVMLSTFNGKVTKNLLQASDFNKTVVELPDAPISDIFDNMMEMYKVFEHADSFTLNRRIEVNKEVMQTAVFKVVNGQDDELTIKVTLNNQTASTYYHRVKDGNNYVFTYKTGDGEWTSCSSDDFEDLLRGINYPISFLNCPGPQVLAMVTSRVIESNDNSFSLVLETYGDNEELVDETITCTFDVNYCLQTMKSTINDKDTYYTFSDYNETAID